MDLKRLRDDINAIDDEILQRLATRRTLVGSVIEWKQQHGLQLRDVHREEELLGRLIAKGRQLGLDAHAVTKIFHEIIDDSLRSQQLFLQRSRNPESDAAAWNIAYQGEEGNFSHLAARKFFASREDTCTFSGYADFEGVIDAVEGGEADYGLLPVENTTAGIINEVYDLLLHTKLSIVGEEVLEIQHCLVAVEVVPLSRIRRVLSQWQAMAQCNRFLSQLENCQKEPVPDTALAVRKVKEDQDLSQAAIAGEEAARVHGLEILERNIMDHPENLTRFIVVAPQSVTVDARIPARTSLIVATPHEAGALLKALVVFERHGINMTKLESRPRKGARFEYLFYIDFEGNVAEPRVEEALLELRGSTSFLKILGSYPIESRQRTAPTIQALAGQPVATATSGSGRTRPATQPTGAPRHRLASRATKPLNTVVNVRGVLLGGPECVIIAGPRVVESEEQILACARHVRECGGKILSGGCFQPRTSPRGYAGLGYPGLQLLAEAGRHYDLPIVTEVLAPTDVGRAAELADMLMVGHQNMQNYSLLSELGSLNRPVILRRGRSASLEQLLDAAEFLLSGGNQQVLLCEHGISTFETTTRTTLDLGGISILKNMTHLPIVVDPSHAAGQWDLVVPLALAARAVAPHAMMIEIHPDPDAAGAAGSQALGFEDFRGLIAELFQS